MEFVSSAEVVWAGMGTVIALAFIFFIEVIEREMPGVDVEVVVVQM